MVRVKSKLVMVVMESLAGSGHKFAVKRPRQFQGKLDLYRFDPLVRQWVIYREMGRAKTWQSMKQKQQ